VTLKTEFFAGELGTERKCELAEKNVNPPCSDRPFMARSRSYWKPVHRAAGLQVDPKGALRIVESVAPALYWRAGFGSAGATKPALPSHIWTKSELRPSPP
jgi:hypothetical protein